MAFFRSERMVLCTMLLHKESAFDCIAELGYVGTVQFNNIVESGHVASLAFTNEVKRCSELQQILQHLQSEFEEAGINFIFYPDVDETMPQSKDIGEVETVLLDLDQELTDVEQHYDALRAKKAMLEEKWYVLSKASGFLHSDRNTEPVMAWSDSVMMSLFRDEAKEGGDAGRRSAPDNLKLGFFAGCIPADRFHAFEVMLWRLCRGNFFMRHTDIETPLQDPQHSSGQVRKYAFVVFFQGDVLRGKIAKMCQGFGIQLYECPESRELRMDRIESVRTELEDLKKVLNQTDDQRRSLLKTAAADYFIWKVKVQRCLMIYFTLNKLSPVQDLNNQKYFQAECWIPRADVYQVRSALARAAQRSSKGDDTMMFPPILTVQDGFNNKVAPTYFRLNRFTRGFQALIDAYGVATYRELNPGPYTIVTFPFLFGVMFGDMGHGLIMSLFGVWMVVKEESLERKRSMQMKQNEIWNILFAGRYIIMLMGIFSMYAGIMYNDVFSKAFNFFGSKWRVNYLDATVEENKFLQLDPATPDYVGDPYILGMDPVWDASGENAIVTFNSLKMKLAIILGVTQMTFGLILGAVNHMYLDNYVDLFLVSAPQLIFLFCLFIYLVILVFYKWTNFGGLYESPYNSACAPSILITFIDMILMKGKSEPPPGCKKLMFEGQTQLQSGLVIIALLCIPILLAGKPLLFMYQERKIKKMADQGKRKKLERDTLESVRRSLVYNVDQPPEEAKKESHESQGHNIGELWIHQGIHCIESVLGSVSHTASYLRLWALSLAHDQLSTVLWNMVLGPFLRSEGWLSSIFLYLSFWAWAILTLAILVVMEGLSAFLHTLRLHWVEFQSKFYSGAGELFVPFRFEKSRIGE